MKKSLAALFSFIPIEQPFEQWSRAAQAKFVPTRVAVSAGNKRLVNESCPKGQTNKKRELRLSFFLLLPRASMSNSHAQHGVVVPAWDTVAVKATLKPSMGWPRRGQLLN